MRTRNPSEDRQRAFLHRCLRTTKPPLAVLADLEIGRDRFEAWMRDAAFRKRFDHVVRHLRRVRELHLQIAAASAVMKLEAIADDKVAEPKPLVRAACVDLIRLAGNRVPVATGEPIDDESSPTEPMRFHPDLAPEDAAALARELSRGAGETEAHE